QLRQRQAEQAGGADLQEVAAGEPFAVGRKAVSHRKSSSWGALSYPPGGRLPSGPGGGAELGVILLPSPLGGEGERPLMVQDKFPAVNQRPQGVEKRVAAARDLAAVLGERLDLV